MISWDAPPPSILPPQWVPPARDDEWRNGVLADRWLRDVVPPRRGGIDTGARPAATLDEAWAGLRDHVWATNAPEIWNLVTSTGADERALGERLLDPRARPGTPAEDLVLVRAYRRQISGGGHPGQHWLVDHLVASRGLAEAGRLLVYVLNCDLPRMFADVLGRLRELLALADDATYANARDAILDARDQRLSPGYHGFDGRLEGNAAGAVFWSVSYLLPIGPHSGPAEPAAHDAALKYLTRFGNMTADILGLASGDAETLERILAINDRAVGDEFFTTIGGRLHLAGLLDTGGAAALCRMRPDPWYLQVERYERDIWTSLLAHIDHDDARAALAELRDGRDDGQPDARTAHVLPEWERKPAIPGTPIAYQPPKPVLPVLREPATPVAPELDWQPGERQRAIGIRVSDQYQAWNDTNLRDCTDAQVTAWLEHQEHWALPTRLTALALAPSWAQERLLALGFTHSRAEVAAETLPLLLARHGVSHVPALVAAFGDKETVAPALAAAQPIGHTALAAPVARAFTARAHRCAARSWLLRHPRHAAAGLVAEWRAKPADPAISRALRWLDAQGHRALLTAGPDAADVAAFLDQDPLTVPKAKRPKIPGYLTGTPLPQLDPPATPEDQELLLVRLAASEPDHVHPAVPAALDTWTAASRAAFAGALLDRWLDAGVPNAGVWCLYAVALLGDDAGLRRLAALARRWAGPSVRVRDQAALEAIRLRGTDAALIALSRLAENCRFPAFEEVVRGHIDEIAELRGLTPDELADRLVPTFGLDDMEAGTLETDAGTFRIEFDHLLMPFVRDASGRTHADLPPPARGEDRRRHRAAQDRLAEVRTEARASASLHLGRMENAMCDERRIPATVFVDRFATHPWMTHLARRLVWGVFVAGELTATVRVAEDGSLATVHDETFALPEDALVSPLHPAEFPAGELAPWHTVLDDYDLMQPFPQLDRPVHRVADTPLDRWTGRTVTHRALRGLEGHGWSRSHDEVEAVQLIKQLSGAAELVLEVTPGWNSYDTAASVPEQTVARLFLNGEPTLTAFSEAVHDLRLL
ncbi:DUF4132 domain-containing protein [Catenuloplanes sp. NPDC051500]|uniref:DUF4132 domain-containing protein n=1 Tax=Catenuloplanes sp. NPDC051500 TaxID=3363959 RepID=UPI00379CAA58